MNFTEFLIEEMAADGVKPIMLMFHGNKVPAPLLKTIQKKLDLEKPDKNDTFYLVDSSAEECVSSNWEFVANVNYQSKKWGLYIVG